MPLAEPNVLTLLDFGPEAEKGILREPPEIVHGRNDPDGTPGLRYTVLVPSVDATTWSFAIGTTRKFA